MRTATMALVAGLLLSIPALADDKPVSPALKTDSGQVRQVDIKKQILVCDLPDGTITYNVAGALLLDAAGASLGTIGTLGAATTVKLPIGQRVQVDYHIQPDIQLPDHGAHATAIRLVAVSAAK
jgi:hypothetical protein